jgi:hypothetical protein
VPFRFFAFPCLSAFLLLCFYLFFHTWTLKNIM